MKKAELEQFSDRYDKEDARQSNAMRYVMVIEGGRMK